VPGCGWIKGKITWFLLLPAMDVWRLAIHKSILPHKLFEGMPAGSYVIRDLRTGFCWNSHRKIFRLSSSRGSIWKEVIYQVDPQLTEVT